MWTRKRCKGGLYEYELKNGLRLVLAPMQNAGSATFQVVYKVGSKNESASTSGYTHLLEHMMFKKSRRFQNKSNNMWYLETLGSYMVSTSSLPNSKCMYISNLFLEREHLP